MTLQRIDELTEPKMMPAISLWQPWASFIAIGAKPYETRHWRAPLRFVGLRIAIHAAKHPVQKDDRIWWYHIAGPSAPLPLGAFVCTAILRSVSPTNLVPDDEFGDYGVGRFAWKLEDPQPFDPPIPAKGAQGFWMWQMPGARP
jgi:activating signal cointegrator 1